MQEDENLFWKKHLAVERAHSPPDLLCTVVICLRCVLSAPPIL